MAGGSFRQGDLLQHGDFFALLPDEEDRQKKIAHEVLARNVFDTTPPWNEIPDRTHFVIKGLVEFVSQLFLLTLSSSEHVLYNIP